MVVERIAARKVIWIRHPEIAERFVVDLCVWGGVRVQRRSAQLPVNVCTDQRLEPSALFLPSRVEFFNDLGCATPRCVPGQHRLLVNSRPAVLLIERVDQFERIEIELDAFAFVSGCGEARLSRISGWNRARTLWARFVYCFTAGAL